MAEYTLDDLYGGGTPPSRAPLRSGYAGGSVQAADAGRAEILGQELLDPRISASDKAAVKREITRLPAGTPKPKPVEEGGLSLDDLYAPEPRSEASIVLGGIGAGAKAVASEIATLGDMLLNTPTSIKAVGANVARRLGGMISGEERKTTAVAARKLQEEIEAKAPNLLKKFVEFFPIPGEETGTPTHVESVMGKVMEWTDTDAQAIEDRTGGALKKEDIQLLRDTALSALGAKGFTAPTKAIVEAKAKKKFAGEGAAALEEISGGVPTAKQVAEGVVKEATVVPKTPLQKYVDQQVGVKEVTPREREFRRNQVRQAFREDPGYADYMRNLTDENIRQAENIVLRPERLKEAEGVLAPRTPPAEPTILKADGTPDTSALMQRSLDTGLEKIMKGQAFDLTATEKIAIRGNAKSWGGMIEKGAADPDMLAIMGLAGVGTALVVAYPEQAKELGASMAGAGLFFSGNLRRIKEAPDTSSLSTLLSKSDTTLKTLERLPQNHTIFKKTLIEEQLKRPDVSLAEKSILKEVLDAKPGEMITPKELIVGFKEATGDWELKRESTSDYADYGLENIGRDPWEQILPAVEGEGVTMAEMGRRDLGEATHVWQLPEHMMMDEGNHFRDPRYFGHTRVFHEGGVRHVVEIQSDLAQKAGKVLTPEEAGILVDAVKNIGKQEEILAKPFLGETTTDFVRYFDKTVKDLEKLNPDVALVLGESLRIRQGLGEFRTPESVLDMARKSIIDNTPNAEGWKRSLQIELSKYREKLSALTAEHSAKLSSGAAASQLGPILKDWHKRLIREELADARGAGETSVRFASPDTVAKVEGWTDIQAAFDRSWGDRPPPGVTRPADRFKPEHQGIYNRYKRDVDKFLKQLGGKEYVDTLGNSWVEVPTAPMGKRVQMLGRADPGLLKTMGAAGAGAVLGAYLLGKEDVTGAVLGAAGGLLGRYAASKSIRVRRAAENLSRGADYAGGLVSTRVKNISEPIHHRLVEHERELFREGHKQLTVVAPFIESLGKVKGKAKEALDAAILTNDPQAIDAAMKKAGVPSLPREWGTVRGLLDEIGKGHLETGLLKNLREDYFPRIVKDLEGLYDHLGAEQKTYLQKKLAAAELHSKKVFGRELTPEERSRIINKEISQAPIQGGGKAGFRKERAIGEITKDLLPFYESPIQSLTTYIRAAVREQAKAKFFGKDAVLASEAGKTGIDLDKSIGALVDRETLAKNLTFRQVEELKGLIRSRFAGGEQATAAGLQDIKNLGYTALLGHPTSAIVQLSDVGQTVFTQGLMPTMEGVVQTLRGKGISSKDFGLLDHVAEELNSTRGTAKVLDRTLKLVGFNKIDKFGKDVTLKAAQVRYEKLAQTAKGQNTIRANYGEAFGPDIDALIADLKGKTRTDLVDSLLFHELSRQQPISRIEVPQAYLDNPNTRVVYMLKTFMLKQMDLARRDAYNEIKKGNIATGAKNLLGLGLLWGVSGAANSWVRDWILGKEVDPKLSDVTDNIFKTFGWSDYVFEKAKQGKPIQAALGTVTPPVSAIDESLRTAQKIAAGEVKKPGDLKGVQNIPVVGRLVYNRLLGGAEEADRKRKLREAREERARLLKEFERR